MRCARVVAEVSTEFRRLISNFSGHRHPSFFLVLSLNTCGEIIIKHYTTYFFIEHKSFIKILNPCERAYGFRKGRQMSEYIIAMSRVPDKQWRLFWLKLQLNPNKLIKGRVCCSTTTEFYTNPHVLLSSIHKREERTVVLCEEG